MYHGSFMQPKFMALLTGALALTTPTPTPTQVATLDTWATIWVPRIEASAQTLFSGPFSFGELGTLAEVVVQAAQGLRGAIGGLDRAKIAQAVLHTTVVELVPAPLQHWVLPLIDGPGAAALIEATFRRVFGPSVTSSPAPVVDAPEVTPGGVQ